MEGQWAEVKEAEHHRVVVVLAGSALDQRKCKQAHDDGWRHLEHDQNPISVMLATKQATQSMSTHVGIEAQNHRQRRVEALWEWVMEVEHEVAQG